MKHALVPGDCFDPKIMIGGGGEKRTLRLVARYADMCNVTGDVSTLTRKIDVLRRHCAEVGRDPADVRATWMTPLILTTSSQNTAETREMLTAVGSAEDTAGFTVGQPHEIPGLVAGHIEAWADEVIFSLPFADTAGISAVAEVSLNVWEGLYTVSRQGEVVGQTATAEEAIALAVRQLPDGLGPAVAGPYRSSEG